MYIYIILSTTNKINKNKEIKWFKHTIMDFMGYKQFSIYDICCRNVIKDGIKVAGFIKKPFSDY